MTTNNIITDYTPIALRASTYPQKSTANAALFQSMLQSHQANSAFGIGSVGTKYIIASPIQANAVNGASVQSTSTNIPENWCISDYYKVPADELIPTAQKLREEMANTDFTGMTDIEIYDYIENRFKDTFGEDFLMACQLVMLDPDDWGGGCNKYQYVGHAFIYELHNQFNEKYRDNEYGITGNVFTIVNRERLYGDMSMDEIMDTIRAKYPPNNQLTNRDVCLMTYEMHMVGAPCYFGLNPREVVSTYGAHGGIVSEPGGRELERIWKEALDKPFNIAVHNSLNNHNMLSMQCRGDYCASVPGQREFLIKYLGATVGDDGYLLPREWEVGGTEGIGSFSFDITVPDLMDRFIKDLDNHYRELEQKRENRRTDKSDADLAELLGGEDSLTQDNTISDISAFL